MDKKEHGNKGRKFSDEIKKRMSERMKEYFKTHEHWRGFKGKIHSVKTKEKMRLKKLSQSKGIQSPYWKGGYGATHRWIKRFKQKKGSCEVCLKIGKTYFANISHEYKLNVTDWVESCQKCNLKYDKLAGWGKAKEFKKLKGR